MTWELAYFLASIWPVIGVLFLSGVAFLKETGTSARIENFPWTLIIGVSVPIFLGPISIIILINKVLLEWTEYASPLLAALLIWTIAYFLAYFRPYSYQFFDQNEIGPKGVVVLGSSNHKVMDLLFGRHQIFKNSPTVNYLERSFVIFSHVTAISTTFLLGLLFIWNGTMKDAFDVNPSGVMNALACNSRIPASTSSGYTPVAVVLSIFSFLGLLMVYCYKQVYEDYSSKWKDSANQLISFHLKNNNSSNARWILALSILNRDLWAKKLFAGFFADALFLAFRKCPNRELKRQLGPSNASFRMKIVKREISENDAYRLLKSCLKAG